jgi:hypothetical protein
MTIQMIKVKDCGHILLEFLFIGILSTSVKVHQKNGKEII